MPLLERLIDDAPDRERDPPMAAAEAMQHLRQSVRRELEALLNARRRWQSTPRELGELPGRGLDFRDPFGNRVQIVQYDGVQFTKTPEAQAELRAKGLAP